MSEATYSQLMEDRVFTSAEKNERRFVAFRGRAIWWRGVMVWGGICGQDRTPLVIVNRNLTDERYIDDILRPIGLFLPRQTRGVPLVRQRKS